MSGPLALTQLTCRTCGTSNPPVYLAPVTVDGTGTCHSLDCAAARGWLDATGNLKKGVTL